MMTSHIIQQLTANSIDVRRRGSVVGGDLGEVLVRGGGIFEIFGEKHDGGENIANEQNIETPLQRFHREGFHFFLIGLIAGFGNALAIVIIFSGRRNIGGSVVNGGRIR
uniref:Uncharacterized protein n=1 Tax=Cacopsylla melanoneura TaxID=428564 RepID=A0A8D9A8I0_9HEMI